MSEEGKNSMNEFKKVVEDFRAQIRSVVENMNHRFDQHDQQFKSLHEQIALLHEGQTEIKISMKRMIDREEFSKLEMRVTRLENRLA